MEVEARKLLQEVVAARISEGFSGFASPGFPAVAGVANTLQQAKLEWGSMSSAAKEEATSIICGQGLSQVLQVSNRCPAFVPLPSPVLTNRFTI